jgi:tellurite resistance protein
MTETEIQGVTADEVVLMTYLDGELSQAERQNVEERLAKEPGLRESLAHLEESWKNLDLLERENIDNEFVEATLETVVFSTEQSIEQLRIQTKHWLTRKTVLAGVLLVVIFCFAFLFGERLAPNNHFLLHVATPIINRLDMYLAIVDDDPELIRLLAERRLFLPPFPENAKPIDPKEYLPSSSIPILDSFSIYPSIAERKHRIEQIENLDESLYSRFYNNCKKFETLPKQKQLALRKMHENIERSPRRYELFQTLQNYYNWRKSLQSYEKADLRRPLPAAERVEQIAELKKRLDANQAEKTVAAPLLAEILKSNENTDLAKVLDGLSMQEKETLLNFTPVQMITTLKQLSEK